MFTPSDSVTITVSNKHYVDGQNGYAILLPIKKIKGADTPVNVKMMVTESFSVSRPLLYLHAAVLLAVHCTFHIDSSARLFRNASRFQAQESQTRESSTDRVNSSFMKECRSEILLLYSRIVHFFTNRIVSNGFHDAIILMVYITQGSH